MKKDIDHTIDIISILIRLSNTKDSSKSWIKITYCARDTKPFMMKFNYLATKIFHIYSLFFKGANHKIYILILLHHAVATCLSVGADHYNPRNYNDM